MAIQWHPLFAELLRPMLEDFYEVLTNVPVGDVPREADLIVLRRTMSGQLPFRGLWKHLRPWNLLEYKGPSVTARLDHVDYFVELGLGIQRRLNSERAKQGQSAVAPADMCFWYFVRRMGRRFRRDVVKKLGPLQLLSDGVWQGRALDRNVLLVDGSEVPIETDTLPLHILGPETPEQEMAMAQLVAGTSSLWDPYAQYLARFHPRLLTELQNMARANKEFTPEIKPFIDFVGADKVIDELSVDQLIKSIARRRLEEADEAAKERLLAHLLEDMTPAKRAKWKRRLEQM